MMGDAVSCPICSKPECKSYPPFDLNFLPVEQRGFWVRLHNELGGSPIPADRLPFGAGAKAIGTQTEARNGMGGAKPCGGCGGSLTGPQPVNRADSARTQNQASTGPQKVERR